MCINPSTEGDETRTGDAAEFEMYSKGLETLMQAKYNPCRNTWLLSIHMSIPLSIHLATHLAMHRYNARPHWGKVSYAHCEYLRDSAYPDTYARFEAIRAAMDPSGKFMNSHVYRHVYRHAQRHAHTSV